MESRKRERERPIHYLRSHEKNYQLIGFAARRSWSKFDGILSDKTPSRNESKAGELPWTNDYPPFIFKTTNLLRLFGGSGVAMDHRNKEPDGKKELS